MRFHDSINNCFNNTKLTSSSDVCGALHRHCAFIIPFSLSLLILRRFPHMFNSFHGSLHNLPTANCVDCRGKSQFLLWYKHVFNNYNNTYSMINLKMLGLNVKFV